VIAAGVDTGERAGGVAAQAVRDSHSRRSAAARSPREEAHISVWSREHRRAKEDAESKRYGFAASGVAELLNRGEPSCHTGLLQRLVRRQQPHVQQRERSSRIVTSLFIEKGGLTPLPSGTQRKPV
jgi:hypothetical protein